MATEEDDINIDDHDNEDHIEEQLEDEEKDIIECFKHDLDEFMREVETEVKSARCQTPASNVDEFFLEENKIRNPVSQSQEKIAEDLFKTKILRSLQKEFWKKFKYFDFYIIVPKFLSLG